MRKRKLRILLIAAMLLLLSGCSFAWGEELYSPPSLSDDYLNLQNKLNDVLKQGAEYCAPLGGANMQSVQLVDLNGDGTQEALAFFQTVEERPLKIYIFQQINKSYEIAGVIEGTGTAINSVAYVNLDDNTEDMEILVSWQMGAKVYSLGAYSLHDFNVVEMLRSGYTSYLVYDISGDGRSELLLIQMDATEGQNNHADCYTYDGSALVLSSSSRLSGGGITALAATTTGTLADGEPAVFLSYDTSEFGILTDVITWKDSGLSNIVYDERSGMSRDRTVGYHIYPTDINGDGVVELPRPVPLPLHKKATGTTADDCWVIQWNQRLYDGTAQQVLTTYYNKTDGWNLTIPDSWVNRITVSRNDTATGQRGVVFSRWRGKDEDPNHLLTIYRLTGNNRSAQSVMGNRFILSTGRDAIYSAEITDYLTGWGYGISKEQLAASFAQISTD